ncbi:MAG: PAS domain S-box protein [Dehalococcoidia bacterium]|nr:PAS domain S-box protein [Dehalococcoidia bacterium]
MKSDGKWDKLDPRERQIAELLLQGKSNAAICAEVFLSRARVQDCIKGILIKTGADSTRGAIALLVGERETLSLLRVLEQASDGVIIIQDRLVKFANRAMESIHEYEPNGMTGKYFLDLIAPASRDVMSKRYELRVQGESVPTTYAIRILCKGGQEKDAMIASAGQISYCGRPAILGIVVERI